MAALLVVKLDLQLTDALFQLLDHSLASLQGIGLSLIKANLELLDLALHGTAHLLNASSMLLFLAELLSNAGSIAHSLLGSLFSSPQFVGLILQINCMAWQSFSSFLLELLREEFWALSSETRSAAS